MSDMIMGCGELDDFIACDDCGLRDDPTDCSNDLALSGRKVCRKEVN